MVTHRFALEDFYTAFDLMDSGACGKVVMFPDPADADGLLTPAREVSCPIAPTTSRKSWTSLRRQGLYTTIRHSDGPQGPWLAVDGRRVLDFCSNNYLGLANHPHLVGPRPTPPLDRYGVGPGAVRTIAGTMTLHDELEERLARFKGVPAAISLQSGFPPTWAPSPRWSAKGTR